MSMVFEPAAVYAVGSRCLASGGASRLPGGAGDDLAGFGVSAGERLERDRQGFVVSEKHGRWGKAIEVPGLGALNQGGNAGVHSVSCASAAYCAADGSYLDFGRQGFVARGSSPGVRGQPDRERPGAGA